MSYADSELVIVAEKGGYCLLTDDGDLIRYAEKDCGITVFDLPTILLALKGRAFSDREMAVIIEELEKKDSYRFSDDVKKVLLETA